MFDNNNNIFYFDYEVQLDTIVKAVCEISVDIGKQLQDLLAIEDKEKGFGIIDLFKSDFLLKMSIREEEILDRNDGTQVIEGIGPDGFFSKIAAYFNNNIFQFQDFDDYLTGSEILVLSKEDSKLLCVGDKPKDRLLSAVKKLKVLKILISELKHEKVKLSLEKLEIFETDLFYKGVITTNKLEGQPIMSLVDISLLNTENLEKVIIDKELYWINEAKFKNIDPTFSISEEVHLLLDSGQQLQIGLITGNHLIPYADVDLSNYVLQERLGDYYFLLFEKTYHIKGKTQSTSKSDLLQRFIGDVKTEELNRLLTYLKNNFYIDNIAIDNKFKDYFSTVVTLDKLDHLDGYQFLIATNSNEETGLGIYSEKKAGTSYNLLHWLNHEDEKKMSHYRREVPDKKNKKQISTLKPEICYYFLEKYFEDLVEGIFKSNGYKFIPNLVLIDNKNKGVEADCFIQVGKKFYYVEEKTKLTKFYIEDFLKKSSDMIRRFDKMFSQGIEIEFILLSSFSDITVKDYQYFIDESTAKEDGYNKSREGINCVPYHFAIPIPDREGRKVTCITEPEFTKLQDLILKVCPK